MAEVLSHIYYSSHTSRTTTE